MTVERQIGSGSKWHEIGVLFERVNAIIRAIALPSLTQLVLRFALAVPFWRSGVNKWDGFLQLNDVAVLLFSSEFELHLPGGDGARHHGVGAGADFARSRDRAA